MSWKHIDFNWIPFLSIDFFEVKKENQLKVDNNKLKVKLISIGILSYQ